MLTAVIKANSYQDSVSLMLLTNHLSDLEGIQRVSVMMGTPANKDIFRNTGMYAEQLDKASPNDLCIVMDVDDEGYVQSVLDEVEHYLNNQSKKSSSAKMVKVRSWDRAQQKLPAANLALISVPGQYAAQEAHRALARGLNVFMFSDNVSVADEKKLKETARDKGLIVMGPDCGTGILHGVPLAFANVVKSGNIGIVGASGTGMQEISTLIDRMGAGISHAIGIGGRDLKADVGGISAEQALHALLADEQTEVIVFVSKPPAPSVLERLEAICQTASKPVVAIFMGEDEQAPKGSLHYAGTLEDAALKAVELAQPENLAKAKAKTLPSLAHISGEHVVRGLYSGGTLAMEAAVLLKRAMGGKSEDKHADGVMFEQNGFQVIDLGDDVYTQGRPHPMIDARTRIDMFKEAAKDQKTAVILFDIVIGYGANADPVGDMLPVIKQIKENTQVELVCSICGTEQDPQDFQSQKSRLLEAGVIVAESNVKAVKYAIQVIANLEKPETISLLQDKPRVVNAGLDRFVDAIQKHGGDVVQFQWQPIAGGNAKLAELLEKLK